MPDVLCYSIDQEVIEEVERLCGKFDLRLKSSSEFTTASEWINIKNFDCIIFDAHVESSERTKLCEKLWSKDPGASVYVFDPHASLEERATEIALEGCIPLSTQSARDRLEKILLLLKRSSSAHSPVSVLVVEDLDSPRDIICTYIEGLGFGKVDGVSSAKKALAILESEPSKYTCVFTDIRMPQMSGKELIEQIRSNPKLKNLAIIVLTAYGTSDTLIDCLKAGASGFLVKPPKKQDLIRELGRAIRISKQQASPRLTGEEEAELLRKVLLDRVS